MSVTSRATSSTTARRATLGRARRHSAARRAGPNRVALATGLVRVVPCTWRDVVARSEELLADDVSGNGSTDRVRLSDRSVCGRVNPIGGRR